MQSQFRTYERNDAVVFRKTAEAFGGLSNMAPGFPIIINQTRILTSEALYQACRFPHLPEVQRKIIAEFSPMTAKMQSKKYREQSRADWDWVRVKIMRWCLRVKLVQNWEKFGELLLATGDKPIVEESRKDDFWGTKITDNHVLIGKNALGRLLMELREELKTGFFENLSVIEPLDIPNFYFLDQPIEPITIKSWKLIVSTRNQEKPQHTFASVMQDNIFEQNSRPLEQQTGDMENMKLKPYSAYKNSDLPWIPRVPQHWKLQRLKTFFQERIQKGFPKEPLLTATQSKGVVRKTDYDSRTVEATKDFHLLKLVEPNDFVISLRSFQGGIEIAHYRGIISPAYTILTAKNQDLTGYYKNFFKSSNFIESLTLFVTGIREGQNIDYTRLARAYFPIPPLEEQKAIVRFLEFANHRIEQYIRAKRKLIALLNEQKQAIIHQAVTKGLDASVPMKDSGVPWLGEIPAHWEVKKLKAIAQIRYGLGQPPRESENGLPLIRATNVKSGKIVTKNLIFVDPKDVPQSRNAILEVGEIIVVRSGALTADSAIIPPEYQGAVAGYDMVVTARRAKPEFIATTLLCSYVKSDQLVIASLRAAQPHLNAQELGAALIVLPPENEQLQIVNFVEMASKPVDETISRAEREIALMREYRTRLVADVVTGQVDVQEAVRGLPEVALVAPEVLAEDFADDETEGESEP